MEKKKQKIILISSGIILILFLLYLGSYISFRVSGDIAEAESFTLGGPIRYKVLGIKYDKQKNPSENQFLTNLFYPFCETETFIRNSFRKQ